MTTAGPPRIVTLEGSETPGEYLGRGERMTVAYTDHVEGMVTRGEAVVVEHNDHVKGMIEQGLAEDASPGIEEGIGG